LKFRAVQPLVVRADEKRLVPERLGCNRGRRPRPGIPGEDVDRLFELYHRTEHAMDTGTDGSCLGLYIVRQIAELHGGEVTRCPGQGATFRLLLSAP
jgi:light-regulated signal transduction histidine kinase (bacteriophytochrome)